MSVETEGSVNYYRRKENQAWELAGCARADGDKADEERWTNEARKYAKLLREAKEQEGVK